MKGALACNICVAAAGFLEAMVCDHGKGGNTKVSISRPYRMCECAPCRILVAFKYMVCTSKYTCRH